MERLVGAAQGRDIVICADRDQAGMRGAHKAMETCKGLARFVRVIWPPAPHKDMRAWLTEGGATLVDVLRLAGRAPDFSDRQGAPLRFDG
jgi:DNA primase